MTFGRSAAAALAAIAGFCMAGTARADNIRPFESLARFSDPDHVVLAVRAEFGKPGGMVMLAAYDSEETFLTQAMMKHRAAVNEDGVAIVTFRGLAPGDYAFVAFYDENGDGRLNRNALGVPTEPFAFSNDVTPKLRRPRFDETSVPIEPGAVVVITLQP